MHGLNAYNPHKAIQKTKVPKTQNFKNDFDIDNPSLNVDHQTNYRATNYRETTEKLPTMNTMLVTMSIYNNNGYHRPTRYAT